MTLLHQSENLWPHIIHTFCGAVSDTFCLARCNQYNCSNSCYNQLNKHMVELTYTLLLTSFITTMQLTLSEHKETFYRVHSHITTNFAGVPSRLHSYILMAAFTSSLNNQYLCQVYNPVFHLNEHYFFQPISYLRINHQFIKSVFSTSNQHFPVIQSLQLYTTLHTLNTLVT